MYNSLNRKEIQQVSIDIAAGLTTGIFCAGLFHPIDRALYLSQKEKKPFFLKENFKFAYHGIQQTIVQRAITSGIYYTMQGEAKTHLQPLLLNYGIQAHHSSFFVGLFAGCVCGAMSNGVSAIKYHTWGHESRSFFSSVCEMWSHGGSKAFLKGTGATITRDIVFGCVYEVVRQSVRTQLPKSTPDLTDFGSNTFAGGLATIASDPFHYARNVQYSTPPHEKPPTTLAILKKLSDESTQHRHLPFGRLQFFQKTLKIGPSTLRASVSMAVGQAVFDATRSQMMESNTSLQPS